MVTKVLSHDDFEDAEVIHTREADDISIQQDDADNQINAIFSEIGSDKNEVNYYFQVWRIIKDQADMAFLFKGSPSDLPIMERLRDEYDGGKFHIQIYRNKKRYKRLQVTVEASKKAAVAQLVKNDMAELMKEMGRQQQENFNMLKDTVLQMVGKPTTPQPSQIEMMTGMMMMFKSMKDFVSPQIQQAPAFNPEKMFDMFLKGMEMGRDSGGSETGLMDIAKELIKSPLLGSLAHAVQNPPQLPPPKPQVSIPAINPTVQPAKGPVMLKEGLIKHYLNMLVGKAEKDSDPILYAEFILDNVPQSMVEENIARDDLIEYASSIDPRVKQHEKWFIELRDHIIAVLTAPDDEEENDATDLPPEVENDVASTPDNATDDPKRPDRDA